MELIKSYEYTTKKDEKELISESHTERFLMKFKHSDELHLCIELAECREKKDFWYLLVKLSELPKTVGMHWGSIIDDNQGFFAIKEKAYIIYNNFSFLYRQAFSRRFYHVLNKEKIIEILGIAQKLAEFNINLIDNKIVE